MTALPETGAAADLIPLIPTVLCGVVGNWTTKRYLDGNTPHLALRNAEDLRTIMQNLVEPDCGRKLVTKITKSAVEKLMPKIAAARPRPSKATPNNWAHGLQG